MLNENVLYNYCTYIEAAFDVLLKKAGEGKGDMSQSNEHKKQYFCQINMVLLYIIEGIAIVMLVILAADFSESVLSVPLVIVFAIIVFLGALTISASIFDHYKLSDKYEALGLPSGSVRALIALTLILIFAIMVIFMSSNLAVIKEYQYVGNSTLGNSTVIYGGKEYTATNGTITLLVGPSEAAINFSNQVLTTVSTLVVALAGFYFGTRSVAQAQQKEPKVKITLDPKSPHNLKKDEKSVKITVDAEPRDEVLKAEIRGDDGKQGSIIKLNDREFEYTPPSPPHDEITVTVDFYMPKYPSDKEELRITIPKQP